MAGITGAAKGIDGATYLAALIEEMRARHEVLADAPLGKGLYRFLAAGLEGARYEEFRAAVYELLLLTSIWWDPAVYRVMPVVTPWCVRDRACRYDQGPESWGAPREDGFLRDDNSIIKKLPLSLPISAPPGHPYAGQRAWRGFTACHIWRDLDDGVAGEDPWLYSFVPNLVWLPTWLAPLSDRQGSWVQQLLQRTSRDLFHNQLVEPPVAKTAASAWARLDAPAPGPSFDPNALATFVPNGAFFKRRLGSLERFVHGCEDVESGRPIRRKIVCSRYTNGLPLLDPEARRAFAGAMSAYSSAVKATGVGA